MRPAVKRREACLREIPPIGRRPHQNLRRRDFGIARLARADQGPVTLIDQHEVQKIAVVAGDFQRRHRQRDP